MHKVDLYGPKRNRGDGQTLSNRSLKWKRPLGKWKGVAFRLSQIRLSISCPVPNPQSRKHVYLGSSSRIHERRCISSTRRRSSPCGTHRKSWHRKKNIEKPPEAGLSLGQSHPSQTYSSGSRRPSSCKSPISHAGFQDV